MNGFSVELKRLLVILGFECYNACKYRMNNISCTLYGRRIRWTSELVVGGTTPLLVRRLIIMG